MTTVNHDDVLVLLEDGPKPATALAEWLRVPDITLLNALTTMRLERLVKRVDGDRWALQADPTPDYRPPTDPRDGFEVVWHPHRDAPSLTGGGASGLGSTLSGNDFKVYRG